jgi:hypothetical protein
MFLPFYRPSKSVVMFAPQSGEISCKKAGLIDSTSFRGDACGVRSNKKITPKGGAETLLT